MNDLMQKLAISKAIMDKHNDIKRGGVRENLLTESPYEDINQPQPKYNIPQDLIKESVPKKTQLEIPTKDRIVNSKLPDEIKKLMLENPINQVSPLVGNSPVLSDELVEKASRLMGSQPKKESARQYESKNIKQDTDLREILKEVVIEVLSENGMILENENKANETILIKVGKHIFEGKISKIKKVK